MAAVRYGFGPLGLTASFEDCDCFDQGSSRALREQQAGHRVARVIAAFRFRQQVSTILARYKGR